MIVNHMHASQRPANRPLLRNTNLVDRMLTFANRHRATGNVLHALETWIDELDILGSRWVKRDHPEYELAFDKDVRGQELRTFVDYNMQTDFLGISMYLRTRYEPATRAAVCEIINKVNVELLYGNLELLPDTGNLRFRFSIDAEGIRLTHTFLNFMLGTGYMVFEQYMPDLLLGPKKLAA